MVELYYSHNADLNAEIQLLNKIIKEINEISVVYNPIKKEFRIYSDILEMYKK